MASSAQQPHEDPAYRFSRVKVTILASEWGSSKGGLSTINRELAIQLAKCPEAEITVFLPQCSEEDKKLALSHNVTIVEATRRPGYEELDWLVFPPKELQIDVVVGHGVKLGRQAQIIRDSHNCRWIQVAHTDPEELGMFKVYANPISKGVEKHHVEVQLCEQADFVIGIGPKLTEAFRSSLRGFGRYQSIHDLTPGIFDEFQSVQQVPDNRENCRILVFGRGDDEDFELKGFDIVARAVASLPNAHLTFVGAPDGKHEEIAARFLQCGIPRSRLKVRGYVNSRGSLKRLFCGVDLALMPSRTEGFGLTGLEALSAGLPVLVSRNSGFGQALSKVPFGKTYVIDSEEPAVWAAAITEIWNKDREERLDEADTLRASYSKKYSWVKQSRDILQKMIDLTHDVASSSHSSAQSTAKVFPCTTQGSQWTADMPVFYRVKEGNPSDYELEGLSQKIVHWKSLGRRLNFREAQLHEFDCDHGKLQEKVRAMLGRWRQRYATGATYQVLYEALCHADVQRKDLAQEFCCRGEGKTKRPRPNDGPPTTAYADEENRAGESDFLKHTGKTKRPRPNDGPPTIAYADEENRAGESDFLKHTGPKLLKSLLEDRDILETICERLDTPVPGLDDYKAVAKHYGFGYFKIKSLLEKSDEGPSKALIEELVSRNRELTVEEFAATVEKIARRKDVAKLLRGQSEYDSIGLSQFASSYIDDRGNNKRDTKKKDDKERMDDGDGDNASEEISEGGEQLPRKQHQIEEEAKKTRVHEGIVTSEGTHWDLKLGAVHLTFPPAAVTEPTLIVVHKWESSVCSPQLQEHEAIVSNVIEISTTTNEALQFKVGVKLVFSHCAPDLQGYELVIKRLINKETNDWKEVEGTVDVRQLSDIEDEYPKEVPDFSFPVVQAHIAECSIFTVICHLIPSPTYTISSRGGCFNHPHYPGVAVTVPKKAVSVKSKCLLQLKVQQVPNDGFEGNNVCVGPILRVSCTQGMEFLKPVTIQLPVAPRVEGGTIPDPSVCLVRVLFLRSDGEKKEWVDITDDLENPARFDGSSITFQVKHFCRYSYVLWHGDGHGGDIFSRIVRFLSSWWTPPTLASFFAYLSECTLSRRSILRLICCPAHLRGTVTDELKEKRITSLEAASSGKKLILGYDKAFVSVSGGISPVNEEDMAYICLRLEPGVKSEASLLIRLISDQDFGFVEFRSTPEPVKENMLAKLPLRLPTLNIAHQPQDETIPDLRDSNKVSSDAVLWLSWKIGNWDPLAYRLGFEQGEVYGIQRDNHGNNSAQVRSMLFRWKERNGQNATLQALCEALRNENVGRTDLAEQMERGFWESAITAD